jgi:hypothetical protein
MTGRRTAIRLRDPDAWVGGIAVGFLAQTAPLLAGVAAHERHDRCAAVSRQPKAFNLVGCVAAPACMTNRQRPSR